MAIGTKEDVLLLPIDEGTQFSLISSPEDNVGNRKPLEVAMQQVVVLDFPIMLATCPSNCSSNGNCTVFGDCICDEGFYGFDCSQG